MLYKVNWEANGSQPQDVDADEESVDGDWVLLKKFVGGHGPVTVFRAKKEKVLSVELATESDLVRDMSDAVAMGRIWGLASVATGTPYDESLMRLRGASRRRAGSAVAAIYEELDVPKQGSPNREARRAAAQRLGTFPVIPP